MLGIPLGLLYTNAAEWTIHRYILHGIGKRRASFWSFHFHEHHRNARTHSFEDDDYAKSPFRDNGQGRELLGLVVLSAAHLPLLPIAPFFTATVIASAANYYRVHRRSHLDPQWAREKLSWHYDHHMGPNQDANWCVTHPLFDHLLGTRIPYVGTPREAKDRQRQASRELHEHRQKARRSA